MRFWPGAGVGLGLAVLGACGSGSTPSMVEPETQSTSFDPWTDTAAPTSSGGAEASTGAQATGTGTTGDIEPPPRCGSLDYAEAFLVPGPSEPGFDAELEATALQWDRLHVALVAWPMQTSADLSVSLDDPKARAAVEAFVEAQGWDFEVATGLAPSDVVASWHKSTGAFAGAAAAADAYRYGTLRDQGYPCEDVERARDQLVAALDGLHRATAITGVPGVIARAYARKDLPGAGQTETTPLFDSEGNPLPPEKDNGTWREDESGQYPDFVWEDSCSRDQLIGWAMGYAAAWEVIRDDPTFDRSVKDRLQVDATAIVEQLATVRDSGYDLEILDADGRITLHGYLHEKNLEGTYVGFNNGQHAMMATGIVAALAFVAEDPQLDSYLYDTLLGRRRLLQIARDAQLIDFGAGTNYSNYNMTFTGAWLAGRYLDASVREPLREGVAKLYDPPGSDFPPRQTAQSFYDLVHAAVLAGGSAWDVPPNDPDQAAVDQALETLHRFPAAPGWNFERIQCDEAEAADGVCELDDGTMVELLGEVGWNDELVSATAISIDQRPPSNYDWRSNPYRVNGGGDGSTVRSGADFRVAYWIGRSARR